MFHTRLLSLVCTSFMDLLGLIHLKLGSSGVCPDCVPVPLGCALDTLAGFFPPFLESICPAAWIYHLLSGSQRAFTGLGKYGRIKPYYFCILHCSKLSNLNLLFLTQLAFMLFLGQFCQTTNNGCGCLLIWHSCVHSGLHKTSAIFRKLHKKPDPVNCYIVLHKA